MALYICTASELWTCTSRVSALMQVLDLDVLVELLVGGEVVKPGTACEKADEAQIMPMRLNRLVE